MNKYLILLRKNHLITLSVLLVTIYLLIILSFNYFDLSKTMFWAPDTYTYQAVGNWLFGIENTNKTISRPFFYPLVLNLSRSFGGVYGIWMIQVVFWVSSGLILYHSIKKVTNKFSLSLIGLIIFASNLTLMLLTLHALTEVTVTLLTTTLLALIVNKEKFKETNYWFLIILNVSILTVTKPVYVYVLYIVLLYRIPIIVIAIIKKKLKLKFLLYIFLALFPVLIQLSIMKVKHNEFTISKIGIFTLQDYFLLRVYREVNNISLLEAREHINTFSQDEMFEYFTKHLDATIKTYFLTVTENLLKGSAFTDHPMRHPKLTLCMKIINKVYFVIHILFILPTIMILFRFFITRNWEDFEKIISLLVPILIIIFTSGITWGQGDRIVLPSLPLWIALYLMIVSVILQIIRKKKLHLSENPI